MITWIGIPTGQRTRMAVRTIDLWEMARIRTAVYAWDKETLDACHDKASFILSGERRPYPVLHNLIVSLLRTWDAYICGADDLWPFDEDRNRNVFTIRMLSEVITRAPCRSVIWVRDGLYDQQPTHAVITRGWYEKYGRIFDEAFFHNCCDCDLAMRALRANELVKCYNIGFEHQHWEPNRRPMDEIDRLLRGRWDDDKKYFFSKYPELKGSFQNYLAEINKCRTIDLS